MTDQFTQEDLMATDNEFENPMPSLTDFNTWMEAADTLRDALDRLRGPDYGGSMRDRAQFVQTAYRWARREPNEGLTMTVAQCADTADWFLTVAQLLVGAAARLSGICRSSLEALEGFRDPRAAE